MTIAKTSASSMQLAIIRSLSKAEPDPITGQPLIDIPFRANLGANMSVKPDKNCKADDSVSMEQFLEKIERRAFHMARIATGSRDDALDIVQDAMYKLVEKYATKPCEQWRPLFYRILNSKISDYYRRKAVKNRLISLASWGMKTDSGTDDLVDRAEGRHSETPERMLHRQKQIEQLTTAVAKLPGRQRQAFMLRCWEGMSTALSAETMGCSEGSVKTHYSRALHSLRDSLEGYWHE